MFDYNSNVFYNSNSNSMVTKQIQNNNMKEKLNELLSAQHQFLIATNTKQAIKASEKVESIKKEIIEKVETLQGLLKLLK